MQSLETPTRPDVILVFVWGAVKAVGANLISILTSDAQCPVLTEDFMGRFAIEGLGRAFDNNTVTGILDNVGYVNPHIEILEIGSSSCANNVLQRLQAKLNRLGKYTLTCRNKTFWNQFCSRSNMLNPTYSKPGCWT